jgi:hypothetical protein
VFEQLNSLNTFLFQIQRLVLRRFSLNSFHCTNYEIYIYYYRYIAFFAGSIGAVLVLLTIIDEDVLAVEHIFTVMTIAGILYTPVGRRREGGVLTKTLPH